MLCQKLLHSYCSGEGDDDEGDSGEEEDGDDAEGGEESD